MGGVLGMLPGGFDCFLLSLSQSPSPASHSSILSVVGNPLKGGRGLWIPEWPLDGQMVQLRRAGPWAPQGGGLGPWRRGRRKQVRPPPFSLPLTTPCFPCREVIPPAKGTCLLSNGAASVPPSVSVACQCHTTQHHLASWPHAISNPPHFQNKVLAP